MDTEDSKSVVNSVLRACRLVELLAADGPEVSLSHAAEATDLTRPTAHRLLATLAVAGWVRRKGYVVSPDDLLPGVTAIGAPVRDASGLVVAGLSVTGTNDRLRGRHRTEVVAHVVAAADEISELLGHRATAAKT
jgi:DNA-binding IclR family transcriptional regulator